MTGGPTVLDDEIFRTFYRKTRLKKSRWLYSNIVRFMFHGMNACEHETSTGTSISRP
jgi:hypothetical protein